MLKDFWAISEIPFRYRNNKYIEKKYWYFFKILNFLNKFSDMLQYNHTNWHILSITNKNQSQISLCFSKLKILLTLGLISSRWICISKLQWFRRLRRFSSSRSSLSSNQSGTSWNWQVEVWFHFSWLILLL